MSAPEQVASTAQEQAGAVAGTAKDQAVSVANTATSAAGEVTSTAKEQVGSVVGETVAQAKDLTGQVKQQASEQVQNQTQKATGALRDLSKQLSEGDTSGVVGTVLTEVGQRVQSLADALESKGPQGLLADARRYARRSPGTFLLTAGLAGLVAGRFAKGLRAPSPQDALSRGTDAGYPSTTYPATVRPVYDAPVYDAAPVYGEPVYADPAPVYPGTAASPYGAGYNETDAYGTTGAGRGAL